jgi:hypothetical protein
MEFLEVDGLLIGKQVQVSNAFLFGFLRPEVSAGSLSNCVCGLEL